MSSLFIVSTGEWTCGMNTVCAYFWKVWDFPGGRVSTIIIAANVTQWVIQNYEKAHYVLWNTGPCQKLWI